MLNSSYDYLSFIFLSFRYISMLTVIILLIEISTCNFYFNNNIFTKSSYNNIRLVFSRFLDLHRNLEIVKEKRLEKLVSPVKKSAYLHASTKQILPGGVSLKPTEYLIFLREIDFETGESIFEKV